MSNPTAGATAALTVPTTPTYEILAVAVFGAYHLAARIARVAGLFWGPRPQIRTDHVLAIEVIRQLNGAGARPLRFTNRMIEDLYPGLWDVVTAVRQGGPGAGENFVLDVVAAELAARAGELPR